MVRQTRGTPQRMSVVAAVLVAALLLSGTTNAFAAATKNSYVTCSPTETEPYDAISCVINVRDSSQEPTMSFDPTQFTAAVTATNAAAVVTTSAMARGTDITTVVFAVTASTGTDLRIRIFLQSSTGTGTTSAEIQGSGLTVTILSWPATHLGPLTCAAEASGLSLRGSTTCRTALYDANNAPSVLHSSDITFSEANVLGSFSFISGTRELVFQYTAPVSTPVVVSTFTLKVRIRNEDTTLNPSSVQTVSIPLLYPNLIAVAAYTGVRCATETRPITCSITASDAKGPVAFNASQFRIRMERQVEASASGTSSTWTDTTNTLNVSLRRSDTRAWVGVLQWEPKAKDSIFSAQLRVQTSSNGKPIPGNESVPAANVADVAGSPFPFTNGVLPNSESVTLRGCRTYVIASGNTTQCFIDLANNVAGDPSYYIVATTQPKSSVSNFTYMDYDEMCQCRSLWFTYHAPSSLPARVDDYINVSVYTDLARTAAGVMTAMNVPYRLNVFPVTSGSGHDNTDDSSVAAVMIFGVFFYGGIFVIGMTLVFRRSRKAARIRQERALKARTATTEMASHAAAGSVDSGAVAAAPPSQGNVDAIAGTSSASPAPPLAAAAASGSAGDGLSRQSSCNVVALAPGAGSNAAMSDMEVVVPNRSLNPPPPPSSSSAAAVVSNAAVEQDRLHSDSD